MIIGFSKTAGGWVTAAGRQWSSTRFQIFHDAENSKTQRVPPPAFPSRRLQAAAAADVVTAAHLCSYLASSPLPLCNTFMNWFFLLLVGRRRIFLGVLLLLHASFKITSMKALLEKKMGLTGFSCGSCTHRLQQVLFKPSTTTTSLQLPPFQWCSSAFLGDTWKLKAQRRKVRALNKQGQCPSGSAAQGPHPLHPPRKKKRKEKKWASCQVDYHCCIQTLCQIVQFWKKRVW